MLYWILSPELTGLALFRFITFRTAAATIMAMLITLIFGGWAIRKLKEFQIGQQIRAEGPSSHHAKAGTPTMGGLIILTGMLIPTILFADLTNYFIWILLFVTVTFGFIGFLDDYAKMAKRRSLGLTARHKMALQIFFSMLVGLFLIYLSQSSEYYSTRLVLPFIKWWQPDIGYFYIFLVVLVIVGCSNAVNLTDGLDGLAIGSVLIASAAYTALAYISGHAVFSQYLLLPFTKQAAEITIFGGALVGSSIGFLWYNAYPAEVFMGDVGSLSLGAAIGTIAVLIKQEFLLIIVGGLFVLEALSVIIQVASYKLTKKRVFLMAPLHHHFELKGWREPKVIIRLWIIAFLFMLLSLTTLKLR
ncbi:phospho-N-acetylmuramoyl-pentapeptide-transferase [bacterium]|nr:phospho-N-acetylmuramoyl-pentapeptide-transferase [bacterium]MCI0602692.1 phospho-N-acetylmuramoyl-pentapeptide-transferase [bacterium]